ncbi:hypothetical protein HHI36_012332 [Cryptolaemus montrouzieri]|uniref:Spaetzle domain-containing protein n=1 Tax=Cryptolaemus montrouzieri TaxID=559131 RepID=A0ABD2NEA5_9CUCU
MRISAPFITSFIFISQLYQALTHPGLSDTDWIDDPYGEELILSDNSRKSQSEYSHVRVSRSIEDILNKELPEKVPDYPKSEISEALAQSPVLKDLFQRIQVPRFSNRQAYDESSDGLKTVCEMEPSTRYPAKMMNLRKEEKYIVNHEGFYQPVYVEVCKPDIICSVNKSATSSQFPETHISTCKQKYTVQRLVAYKSEKKSIVVEEFRVPCACVCVVEKKTRDRFLSEEEED